MWSNLRRRYDNLNEMISEFLIDEVSNQECYDSIYNFIADQNIRTGEYEGNIFVIKKMGLLHGKQPASPKGKS